MENITKALLIAGGVLIAIMLLTLLVIFWSQMSGYFTEEHDSKIIEQTVEFNNRFENYNGQTIRGNELISVMNRIVDYNNTYTGNMEDYDRVIISVNLKGHKSEFAYDGNADLFPHDPINNNANDDDIKDISGLSATLTSSASGIPGITDIKLQKLSAEIHNIVEKNVSDFTDTNGGATAQQKLELYKETRAKKLKSILGYTVESTNTTLMNNIIDAAKQYYQYTQFKRAMFECKGVTYNTTNGRVNGITFEVVTVTNADGTHIKFN